MCRGGALALTSTTLAVTAHALGGAGMPDAGLTLLLACGVGAAGTALADRRRGPLAILTAVGASHLGIHLILAVAGPPGSMGASSVGGSMVGAHVLAVVLAGLVLAHAESALFAIYAVWAMSLPRRMTPRRMLTKPRFVPHPRPVDDWLLLVLYRRVVGRRAPPLPC